MTPLIFMILVTTAMYSEVNALDVITTIAGGGSSTSTYSGDGNAATSATFNNPISVALDLSGNSE